MSQSHATCINGARLVEYKTVLRRIVLEQDDFPPPDNEAWTRLPPPNHAILADAHEAQTPLINRIRASMKASDCPVKFSIIGRPTTKCLKRVSEKLARPTPTPGSGRSMPQFKANVDLVAMRFQVEKPGQIIVVQWALRKMCEDAGDMHFREDSSLVNEHGMPSDIVSMAVLYSRVAGYLAEIQIGSKFVFYTLKQDSNTRNMPEEQLRVDRLWQYYKSVKALMLKYPAGILETEMEDEGVVNDINDFKAATGDYITWLHAYDDRKAAEEDIIIAETMRPWIEGSW